MVLSLFRFFVYGNVFIALCFLAISIYAYSLLNFIPEFVVGGFIFASTLSHYTLHRLFFLRLLLQTKEPLPSRFLWVHRNKRFLISQAVLSTITAVYFYFLLSYESKLFLLPFIILGTLYLTPFKKSLSIRSVSYIKNLILTICIIAIAFGLPMVNVNGLTESFSITQYLPQLYSLFLYIFGIAIVFDIRDFWLDKHFGIKTLPMLLGKKWLKMLSLLCIALSLYNLFLTGVNVNILISIGIFSLVFVLLSTTYRTNLFYGLFGDACIILYALLLSDVSNVITYIQLLWFLG